MSAKGAGQSLGSPEGARRGPPTPAATRAPSRGGGAPQAQVVDQALGLVLGNAAARAALLTIRDGGYVEGHAGRDAVRLASKGLRVAYDEHVTRAEIDTEGEGFSAGVSPRQFCWPRLLKVRVDGNCALVHAVELLRAAAEWPRLREARLGGATLAGVKKFLRAPLLELADLSIGFCSYEPGAPKHPLAPAEYVSACEALRLARLPLLQTLELSQWGLDAANAALLAAAEWPEMKELSLYECSLTAGALNTLASAAWAGGLERLDLRACKVGAKHHLAPPEYVAAFQALGLARLPRMKTLKLSEWGLDAAGAAHLASAAWPQLRELSLLRCSLTAGALKALAAAPSAGRLESLNLAECKLGAPHVRALRQGRWPRLRRVSLTNNSIGDAGVAELVAAPWASGLEDLDLSHTKLTAAGARLLLRVRWQRLRRLDLSGQYPDDPSDSEYEYEGDGPDIDLWDELDAVAEALKARLPGLEVDTMM